MSVLVIFVLIFGAFLLWFVFLGFLETGKKTYDQKKKERIDLEARVGSLVEENKSLDSTIESVKKN